eukprot:13515717-Heterocapsa_arctica.AAC.1
MAQQCTCPSKSKIFRTGGDRRRTLQRIIKVNWEPGIPARGQRNSCLTIARRRVLAVAAAVAAAGATAAYPRVAPRVALAAKVLAPVLRPPAVLAALRGAPEALLIEE